jgi:hypothetical protein
VIRRRRQSNARRIARVLLLIVGVLTLLMGLLWIGQGTGIVPWPKSSFMISEIAWAYRGAALAATGALMLFISRQI